MTKKGTKCRRSVSCRWHKQDMCPICLEDVPFKQIHRTSCGHVFHSQCMLTWFVSSDECPVCRHEEKDDPVIIFKHNFHERISENYMETIQSLESDIAVYRRRARRARALRDE